MYNRDFKTHTIHFYDVLNSAKFEQNCTCGPHSLIFQVKVPLRSCDWRLSVIVTNVSITAAEIITRVNWTIVVYPSIRYRYPRPPSWCQQLWASVSFQIILISYLSILIEELQKVSFKHHFEHCILLITKSFELLMFTQVFTPEGSFSLSATAETKVAFNTHAFSTCSCYSVQKPSTVGYGGPWL